MDHVKLSEILNFLGITPVKSEQEILGVCPLDEAKPGHLMFSAKYSQENVKRINQQKDGFVIACPEYGSLLTIPHILSDNSKYDFAKVFAEFFPPLDTEPIIGEGTIIESGCVIRNAIIGKNCYIKSNTVIGQKGFSFVIGPDGRPFPMPHAGRVFIGDNVEIGACNTIVRGVMGNTRIGDYVKTDDHVHIAHNVKVGENTLITACTEISGSVVIGRNVWIAPHCSILNHVEVGDGAYLCINSVVGKNVKPNTKVFGFPAREV